MRPLCHFVIVDASVPSSLEVVLDPRGWLATRKWARGGNITATYSHNRLGELTGISYSGGLPGDVPTPNVTIARDNQGRVTGVTDGAGNWSYGYDAAGRLERETNVTSGNALIYGRDNTGRRTGYSFWDTGSGSWATWGGWGYDAVKGRLNGVDTPEGWISQDYESGTNRTGMTAVITGTIAVRTFRTYNQLGQLTSIGTYSGPSNTSGTLVKVISAEIRVR